MDRARDEFLSRAAFPQNQDRGIGRREGGDLSHNSPYSRAAPNDPNSSFILYSFSFNSSYVVPLNEFLNERNPAERRQLQDSRGNYYGDPPPVLSNQFFVHGCTSTELQYFLVRQFIQSKVFGWSETRPAQTASE